MGLHIDARTVWLFVLDNTLHDAGGFVFGELVQSMRSFIERELGLDANEDTRLNLHYWQRYGATLPGLMRRHGVQAAQFLHRFARRDLHGGPNATRWSMQPAYVDRRVRRLSALLAR